MGLPIGSHLTYETVKIAAAIVHKHTCVLCKNVL